MEMWVLQGGEMSKNRNFGYECLTTQFVDVSSISCEYTRLAEKV
jgi:hypothetical protein